MRVAPKGIQTFLRTLLPLFPDVDLLGRLLAAARRRLDTRQNPLSQFGICLFIRPSVVIEKSPSLSQLAQQGDFSISNHTRIIKSLVSLEIPKFAKELAAE